MGPLVTIGVPVYQGQDDLPFTLECVRAQTYRNLDVLISVDNADFVSVEAAKPFLSDPRFRLQVQSRRLGWAGNTDWTIRHRRGEFYIYQQHDDQVDEWPLAHEAAEYIGVTEHVKVSGESASPLQALERTLAIHSEPAPAALGHYWVHCMLSGARQRGLGTLLIGQMGNGTVSWTGGSLALAHLAVTGHWSTVWRELRGESGARGVSAARAAWRRLIRPVVWSARAWLQWQFGEPRTVWAEHVPLDPGFLKRSGIVKHMRRTEPRLGWFSARTPRAQQLVTLMPGVIAAGAFLHEAGAAYGLEMRDPTADIRLVEFCLGIPCDQYFRNGESRWLIRRAMQGLLPPKMQWNTRRGIQSPEMTRLALRELTRIGEAVARVESSRLAPQYLAMPLLRQFWADMQRRDLEEGQRPTHYLLGMLSVGLFVVREEEAGSTLV